MLQEITGEAIQITSKPKIYQKKIILSVWRELIPQKQTINSKVYVEPHIKPNDAIEE